MTDTLSTGTTTFSLGRRALLGGAAAVAATAALASCSAPAGDSARQATEGAPGAPRPREGLGSVPGAPNLPPGFTDAFTSRCLDTAGLRQHAVVSGDGPPLLLVHGWPQTWYAWRLLMPTLARDFQVVAVDQRGTGLTGRPLGGYDTGNLGLPPHPRGARRAQPPHRCLHSLEDLEERRHRPRSPALRTDLATVPRRTAHGSSRSTSPTSTPSSSAASTSWW
jgi:alpha/beta hydrolase fold